MKHDHRSSCWIIGSGENSLLWCYQCGAWRPNTPGRMMWNWPTGMGGKNPAMKIQRKKKTEREIDPRQLTLEAV